MQVDDVPPPWIAHPDYDRYSIGWRMGDGEDVMHRWWCFVDTLRPELEPRLAYLLRFRPAPFPWADLVHEVLYGDSGSEPDLEHLRGLGLVASDVAYSNWLQLPRSRDWRPWLTGASPQRAARYSLRSFWFWSRQSQRPESVPENWSAIHQPIDTRQGLLTLSQMMWKGPVTPPWTFGLSVDDFADSFEDDMGYPDAFRLWCIEAIDDVEQFAQLLGPVPADWGAWLGVHGPEQ